MVFSVELRWWTERVWEPSTDLSGAYRSRRQHADSLITLATLAGSPGEH